MAFRFPKLHFITSPITFLVIFAKKNSQITYSMKKILFLLVVSIALISCGPSDDKPKTAEIPTIFRFSDLKYFINFHTLMRDNGISSNLMSKVDSMNAYSFGFQCEMQKLHGGKASSVSVKTRYYYPGEGDISMVCTISQNDKVLFWQGIPLPTKNAVKKWADIEEVFDFKKTFSSDEVLTIYVWSPKKTIAYIDQLDVTPKE
jgi:hypothetical protein